jgi:hypothetical protein
VEQNGYLEAIQHEKEMVENKQRKINTARRT